MPRQIPLRRLRTTAAAPRVALVVACVVLSLAGFASVFRGPPSPEASAPPPRTIPADAAAGLAEVFAASYLDGGQDQDRRARDLESLGLPADATSRDRRAASGSAVLSTAVVSSRAMSPRIRRVVVAARRTGGTTFLRVTVSEQDGRLTIAEPPAVVGPPQTAPATVRRPELVVEDRLLTAAAARVVRHYLAGKADELSADLAAGVRPSLPATSLRVASVVATTWVRRPRRIATEVLARSPGGQQLTLRYELEVVRVSGRWLVTEVDTPTNDREVTP